MATVAVLHEHRTNLLLEEDEALVFGNTRLCDHDDDDGGDPSQAHVDTFVQNELFVKRTLSQQSNPQGIRAWKSALSNCHSHVAKSMRNLFDSASPNRDSLARKKQDTHIQPLGTTICLTNLQVNPMMRADQIVFQTFYDNIS